ncbi:MAG: pectate lyase [Bryobacteraceae bacterium]|nr:pectate lyase [Bryobacteraceae bacterium]
MLTARLLAVILGFSVCLTAAPVRIILVGDSTVNDEGGWGPGFASSFAGAPVEVVNLAKNGRSSKSFRDEGLWAKVLTGPKPDYVLIQFGHNDCPGKGPERETVPQTTYRANLTRFIEEVRAAGGTPVLVPFVEETRRLGASLRAPVMDLYQLTWAQTEALGPKRADTLGAVLASQVHPVVSWKQAMGQRPEWYGSAEAARIGDSLLAHQHENGGWLKNIDMALPPFKSSSKDPKAETTIDNGATWTQMQYLARVYTATRGKRFADAFRRGFRFLLAAQYPNGGWPQFYPLKKGYYTHITYNDNAMAGVMATLRSVAEARPDYAFFTGEEREQARAAVGRGIAVILKSQIVVDGKRTVWCAQHDEETLAAAKARSYELPSYSGAESVGLVRLLMEIEKPSPEVVAAVESAVAWFRTHAVRGIRQEQKPDPASPKGWDKVIVADAKAAPLWARFYDLKNAEPMFCGRDGVPKKTMAEIEYERRNGYNWYTEGPAELLDKDYPKWKARRGTMLFGDSSRLGRPFAKDPSAIRWGGRYLMYFSIPGTDDKGWSVGIAESRDLVSWTSVGQVLPEAGGVEAKGLAAPYARVVDGEVHLFYQTYGNAKNDAICHAVSKDGIKFRRDPSNPIFKPTGEWNAGRAIDAEVAEFKGKWYLFAATRDPEMKVQMLVGAVAEKGRGFGRDAWKQIGNGPLLRPELAWEKDCIEAPAIVVRGDWMYMFYAGAYNNAPQQVGVARSRDGVKWERVSREPFLANGKPGEWNSSESGHPGTFVDEDGQTYLFYQGNADNGRTWFLSRIKVGWDASGRPVRSN